ncbi:MAG: glycosyltransferase [Thermoanaerobaculia bacterium]
MIPAATVVLPAFNPRRDYLQAALEALRCQSLDTALWEIVLVDNRSAPPIAGSVDLSWHPSAQVVREERLGLTRARLAGFQCARGALIVLVDDDNILRPDYLMEALEISRRYPLLGSWGGRISPRFERPEMAPPPGLSPLLSLREVNEDCWSNDPDHHASTPWGAGLCVRRAVADQYSRDLEARKLGIELDLQGERLVYGGDTDIAYIGCGMGHGKGVFKALQVEHLIPPERCQPEYLCRVAEGRGYSEVLHELVRSGSFPVEDRSLASWLRLQRAARTGTALERRVTRARLDGRRRAFRELGAKFGDGA